MNTSHSRSEAASASSLVWQLVERLDEQRAYPRIPLDLTVTLVTGAGENVPVAALNMSPDGMQVRCGVEAARLLHPGGGRIVAGAEPRMRAVANLRLSGGPRTLVAPCRLLYLTMVDTDPRCVLGLRFDELDREAQRIVGEFFADQFADDSEVA